MSADKDIIHSRNLKVNKKLHEYFDRTYLINLDSRSDRLQDSKLECDKYGIQFERFRACDGYREIGDIIPAGVIGIRTRHWNKAAAGICVSTIRLLEQCQKDRLNTVLIMEDDIHFNPRIYDILDNAMHQVPKQWESIFFGLLDLASVPISENVSLIKSGLDLHCYALKKDVFQFVIDFLSAMNNPADGLYDAHLFPRNQSYVIKPHLAWQRFSLSSITGRYYFQRKIIPDDYQQEIPLDTTTTESSIHRLVNIIADDEKQIELLERKLHQIETSITWQVAGRLHHIIDSILPAGTKRRLLVKRVFLKIVAFISALFKWNSKANT